jgi:hypothetical protein
MWMAGLLRLGDGLLEWLVDAAARSVLSPGAVSLSLLARHVLTECTKRQTMVYQPLSTGNAASALILTMAQ